VAASTLEDLLVSLGVDFLYLIYNILIILIAIAAVPYFFIKNFSDQEELGLKERFGFYSTELQEKFKQGKVIWIHAASAGETLAALELVEQIRLNFSDYKIVFSNMTPTGHQLAIEKLSGVAGLIYFPVDISYVVKKALRIFKPEVFITVETELWPNFIKAADRAGVKMMVASGRISDDTFDKYQKIGLLVEDMLGRIDLYSMQNEEAAVRINELGAPQERICINGNIKYDLKDCGSNNERKQKLMHKLKIESATKILLAGSTHQGEEKIIYQVYKKLKVKFPNLLLIIAPRYIKRTEELLTLFAEEKRLYLYSEMKRRKDGWIDRGIIIVDTMGELADLYHLGGPVFIGGSLIDRGGHNLIEAAALGKVVISGPSVYNFKEERDLLVDGEAAFIVENEDEFRQVVNQLFSRPELMIIVGERAADLVSRNRGAVKKHVKLLQNLLQNKELNNYV